ncbi:MAG: hypothetical protein JJT87_14485 [Halomonas sp.]|nr:hypothetical protein [Halomonas sp.]
MPGYYTQAIVTSCAPRYIAKPHDGGLSNRLLFNKLLFNKLLFNNGLVNNGLVNNGFVNNGLADNSLHQISRRYGEQQA